MTAMMSDVRRRMERLRIFVPLVNAPSELRAAQAVPAGEGRFRLVSRPQFNDRWQFTPGEIIECDSRTLPDGSKVLVAVSSASSDPEYRKRRTMYAVLGAIVGAFSGAWFAFEIHPGAMSLALGAVIGGCLFAMVSVRWRDAAWWAWFWWESLEWRMRGW